MTDKDEFAERVADAIGAEEGDTIRIQTPQFERTDDKEVAEPPLTPSAFEALRDLSAEELTDLGFQSWDGDLHLLPAEWYPHVPEGVEFTSIMGRTVEFEPGETDDDRRFGALPYGFVVGMDAEEWREAEREDGGLVLEETVVEEVDVEGGKNV